MMRHHPEALAALSAAFQAGADPLPARHALANALTALGRWGEAAECREILLREVDCQLATTPGDPVLLRKRGALLFDLDRWEEALAGLRLLGQECRDFGDTAALLSLLDVVVTVDTAVAHLAGALGRPVCILLAQPSDWRWMLRRDDSPWYPSARLFRQERRGDWAGVMARLVAHLDGAG